MTGRRAAGVLVVLLGSLTATACGGGSSASGSGVTVQLASEPGLGQVLVDGSGHTLYLFVPDKHASVTCADVCEGTWPPLFAPATGSVKAGPGVDASALGADPDRTGREVVTYHGWPLYTYLADVRPHVAAGQALDLNGGLWYVVNAQGNAVTTKPH